MGDVLTWGAAIAASGSLVAVITFWMNRGKAEAEAFALASAAGAKADAATAAANAALAKAEAISEQLAEARIQVAQDYVSHRDLAAAELRLASAVEGLRKEFHNLNDRLDRIVEALTHHNRG